jgi:hypothetical protein
VRDQVRESGERISGLSASDTYVGQSIMWSWGRIGDSRMVWIRLMYGVR